MSTDKDRLSISKIRELVDFARANQIQADKDGNINICEICQIRNKCRRLKLENEAAK